MMNNAKNDQAYDQSSVDLAFAGFEIAVVEFERGEAALAEAQALLEHSESQWQYARLCMEESDAELELVTLKVNSSQPHHPDYPALIIELDILTDNLLKNTELFELATAHYQFAQERYQSELASHRETTNIANALSNEVTECLQWRSHGTAANDEYFDADDKLNRLSDDAYHYLLERNSAQNQ